MGFEKVFLKILWLKYCTYMFPPQTYKTAKCLSEFSKTGLNKRIPREGTRTLAEIWQQNCCYQLNKRILIMGTRIYLLLVDCKFLGIK